VAAEIGHAEVAILLLDEGGDINTEDEEQRWTGQLADYVR